MFNLFAHKYPNTNYSEIMSSYLLEKVDAVNASTDSIRASITALNESVSTLNDNVNALNNAVGTLTTDIDTLTNGVNTLKNRVDALDNDFNDRVTTIVNTSDFDGLITSNKHIIGAINECAQLIPNPDVFIATYGETTHHEIATALDSGRVVMVKKSNNEGVWTDNDFYHLMRRQTGGASDIEIIFGRLGWRYTTSENDPRMLNTIESVSVTPDNTWLSYRKDL